MHCFFHNQKTHIQLIILKFDELFDESFLRSMNVSIVDSGCIFNRVFSKYLAFLKKYGVRSLTDIPYWWKISELILFGENY